MEIPESLSRKVTDAFGDTGREWLLRAGEIYEQCIDRWSLSECAPSRYMSYNLVYFACSPEYGAVVLKIGCPNPELYTALSALSLYRGRGMCRCLDSDRELGAMLLERIVPGADLTTVPGLAARSRIAAELIAVPPIPGEGLSGFPTYAGWMRKAFDRARHERVVGVRMSGLIGRAEALYADEIAPGRREMLLHGDLNPTNILRDSDGGWRAIDPKGALGPACLEAGRFVINEIEALDPSALQGGIGTMTSIIGERLGETPKTIAACAFIDCVLSTCWSVEENMPQPSLGTAIDRCAVLLEHAEGI